jgi:LacI family transcriptional regulator
LPLIVVGRTVPGLEQYSLNIDHLQGGYAATRYLLELGHQRIAHITGLLSHSDALERRKGYLQALAHAGIVADERLSVEGDYSEQSGLLAVETLFSRGIPFTALFAANDQTAYGARLALFRRGIRVPDDVSLVGFDDQPGSAYTTPPLTTVHQPTSDMGRAAAQAALQLLAGAAPTLPRFATQLVVRESAMLRR